MADWRTWYEMALTSQRAAQLMASDETLARPCASRIYYAAYQAVTAVLLYQGLAPPAPREAWAHERTAELIVEQWAPLVPSLDRRRDLAKRLADMYKLRLNTDSVGNSTITVPAVRKAMRDGNFLVKIASELLPEE